MNDDLGHHVGDVVLAEIARRLANGTRPGDTVARHGGDEFVLCCEDLGDSPADAREAIEHLVARVLEAVAEPIDAHGHAVTLTASAGIVLTTDDGSTPAALVALADAAMYEAKRAGAGRTAFAGDV